MAIFKDALRLLRDEPPDAADEHELNRSLHLKVVTVLHRRLRDGPEPLYSSPPVWEGQNPPSPTTEGTGAEAKRPDFYWGYVDGTESDVERSSKHLVIECKRLGRWDFNRKYVRNGIVRFVAPEHSYGKDAPSGAMIGYVQSMETYEILTIVNEEIASVPLPALGPVEITDNSTDSSGATPGDALNYFEHTLTRSFPVDPFRLLHIWMDMRSAETEESDTKFDTRAAAHLDKPQLRLS
jgi:hypothetical protein